MGDQLGGISPLFRLELWDPTALTGDCKGPTLQRLPWDHVFVRLGVALVPQQRAPKKQTPRKLDGEQHVHFM